MRGWLVSESFKHALNNKLDYINFGAIAFALEVIPIANIFFTWTNIIGTALWVADEYRLEKGLVETETNSKNQIAPKSVAGENTPLLADSSHRA